MSDRFAGLQKLPQEPAARRLAATNVKLQADHGLPASATIPEVMAKLEEMEEYLDIITLFSASLPPREAVWYTCLAGRDIAGANPPQTLSTAEAWVFRPSDDTRRAARKALDAADFDDTCVHCASAAVYADGTLGPGELDQIEAPPNAISASIVAMNMLVLSANAENYHAWLQHLIDRAIDIAKGGNGQIDKPKAPTKEAAPEADKEVTA